MDSFAEAGYTVIGIDYFKGVSIVQYMEICSTEASH